MAAQCTSCGLLLADGAKFCQECGAPARQLACTSCGAAAGPGRFCAECGFPAAARSEPVAHGAPVAERRLTSILFADLVGFTSLAQTRDPEEVRELLSQYFERSRTVVQRYGGTVEKFIGDAVMAVWGVPVAHEDDAERCVRAGLDLIDLVATLGEELGLGIALRVGVVTGEVAVTLGATGEGMVAGDAVNTASRVQGIAEPGTVWVDEATRSLTAAAVTYRDVGEHALKGKPRPLRLHQARSVVAAVGGAQRVDGLEAPFMGRDRELRLVKELFHATVEDGRPRMVLVSGVAGIGKSRVGWEFEKYADGLRGQVRWHRGRCLSYGDGVAFWALAEMVRSRLGLTEGDSGEATTERLDAALADFVAAEQERDWLRGHVAVLLGAQNRSYPREDLFAAWTIFLERVWEGSDALVLLFEDLQHADDGLLDFVEHALATARFPLFVLGLARPELQERRPNTGAGRRGTTIHLEPLSVGSMAALVDGLVEGLPPATREHLVTRAEGVPLYAVETVRALIDCDAVLPLGGRYVLAADAAERIDLLTLGAPASLQALVASRLDALAPAERSLVQDAAVLGTSFTRSGLLALDVDQRDLEQVLQSLVRKEILVVQSDPRSTERGQFTFVQSVVRQVAYDTLSRRDRKARHLAVARHLSDEADSGDDLAAVLAQHYLDALRATSPDDGDRVALEQLACRCLVRAAERSRNLGSPVEAVRHYASALKLLEAGGAADGREAAVLHRTSAGAALTAGLLDLAAEHAHHALATFDRLGEGIEASRAAALLGSAMVQRHDLSAAVALLSPRVPALEASPDAEPALLEVLEVLSRAYAFLGEVDLARRAVERTLPLAEGVEDHERLLIALTSWAVIWITSGSPTAGLALLTKAVELGRAQQFRAGLIRPLLNLSAFNNARDLEVACSAGWESTRLAEQTGSTGILSWGATNLGLGLMTAGRWAELTQVLATPWFDTAQSRFVHHVLSAQLAAARGGDGPELPADVAEHVAGEDVSSRFWAMAAASTAEPDPVARAALSAAAARGSLEAAGFEDDFVHLWVLAVEDAMSVGAEQETTALVSLAGSARVGRLPALVKAELLRFRGLLAAVDGQGTVAAELLSSAVRDLTDFGAVFAAAKAELALADLLDAEGERNARSAALDNAERAFEALGAQTWLQRVARARDAAVPLA